MVYLLTNSIAGFVVLVIALLSFNLYFYREKSFSKSYFLSSPKPTAVHIIA